jgi:hypothetical protein
LQAKFAELDLDVRPAKQAAAERRVLDELKAQIAAVQDQAEETVKTTEELKRVHAAEVGRLEQLLAQAEAKVQTLLAAQAEVEAKSAVSNESEAGAAESKGDDGLPEPEAPQAAVKASRKRKSPMADSPVAPALVSTGASAGAGDRADDRVEERPAKRARTRAQHQAVQEEGAKSTAKNGKKGKKGKRK